jgi:hypothetical protein
MTDEATSTIRIVARLDRRRTEALMLALRQRLRALGIDGAQLTVSPSPTAPPAPTPRHD